MSSIVRVAQTARQDLHDIFDYLVENESREQATITLEKVSEALLSLQKLPKRGKYNPELEAIGSQRYREILCRPYRIIYEVMKEEVMVHCVLDARRDVQSQLMKRLVRS